MPDGFTETYAELDKTVKNTISHRCASLHLPHSISFMRPFGTGRRNQGMLMGDDCDMVSCRYRALDQLRKYLLQRYGQ
jgi:inosine/xanthosine triphosphate pyrophosphatase family protein